MGDFLIGYGTSVVVVALSLFQVGVIAIGVVAFLWSKRKPSSQDVSFSATKPYKAKAKPTFEPDFQKVGSLKHYEEQIQTAVHGIAFHSDDRDDGLDKDYWIDWLTKMAKKRRQVLDSIDEDEKLFKAVTRIVKQS